MTTITIPYPPSVNHYWRMFRGRMLISADGRRYRLVTEQIMRAARIKPIVGHVWVIVQIVLPDRRRRDIDNVLKSLLDAMKVGGLYADDSQIRWLLVYGEAFDPPDGYVTVRAFSADDASDVREMLNYVRETLPAEKFCAK